MPAFPIPLDHDPEVILLHVYGADENGAGVSHYGLYGWQVHGVMACSVV